MIFGPQGQPTSMWRADDGGDYPVYRQYQKYYMLIRRERQWVPLYRIDRPDGVCWVDQYEQYCFTFFDIQQIKKIDDGRDSNPQPIKSNAEKPPSLNNIIESGGKIMPLVTQGVSFAAKYWHFPAGIVGLLSALGLLYAHNTTRPTPIAQYTPPNTSQQLGTTQSRPMILQQQLGTTQYRPTIPQQQLGAMQYRPMIPHQQLGTMQYRSVMPLQQMPAFGRVMPPRRF